MLQYSALKCFDNAGQRDHERNLPSHHTCNYQIPNGNQSE